MKKKTIEIHGRKLTVYENGEIWREEHIDSLGRTWKRKSWVAHPNPAGYMYVSLGPKKVAVHRAVAQAFLPSWDEALVVDHIDGGKSNNHYTNLRMVTRSQNNRGYRTSRKKSSSKYRGVSFDKSKQKWAASILIQKGTKRTYYHIGRFENERDAAIAWNRKATELGYYPEALNEVS